MYFDILFGFVFIFLCLYLFMSLIHTHWCDVVIDYDSWWWWGHSYWCVHCLFMCL